MFDLWFFMNFHGLPCDVINVAQRHFLVLVGLAMTCSIFSVSLLRSKSPSASLPPNLILLNVKNVQLYHIAVQLKPKTEKTDKPTDSTRIEIKIIHLSSSQPPIKPETKTLIYAIISIRFKNNRYRTCLVT